MTSSTALASQGLFEQTRCPSLTQAVSLSFAEIAEDNQVGFIFISARVDEPENGILRNF